MACEHAHLRVEAPALEHPPAAEPTPISTASAEHVEPAISVRPPAPVAQPAPDSVVRPVRLMTRAGPKWQGVIEKPRVTTEAKP